MEEFTSIVSVCEEHITTVDFKSESSKEDLSMSTVVQNFDVWKKFLGQRVEQAEKLGISQDTIAELAYEIGDFLDEKVDPANHSNRALKELWGVADEEERHTIARLMVKLAKSNA